MAQYLLSCSQQSMPYISCPAFDKLGFSTQTSTSMMRLLSWIQWALFKSKTGLLDLPQELLDDIFENFSFDEHKLLRLVCKRFSLVLERTVFAAAVIDAPRSGHWNSSLVHAISTESSRVPLYARQLTFSCTAPRETFTRIPADQIRREFLTALQSFKALEVVRWNIGFAEPGELVSGMNTAVISWLESCQNLHQLYLFMDGSAELEGLHLQRLASPNLRHLCIATFPVAHLRTLLEPCRNLIAQSPGIENLEVYLPMEMSFLFNELLDGLPVLQNLKELSTTVTTVGDDSISVKYPFGPAVKKIRTPAMTHSLSQAFIASHVELDDLEVTSGITPQLLTYLGSYTSLRRLSIPRFASSPLDSIHFYSRTLTRHVGTLEELELHADDSQFAWGFRQAIAPHIQQLRNLKCLSIDFQYVILSAIAPNVTLLLETAAVLPQLLTVEIRSYARAWTYEPGTPEERLARIQDTILNSTVAPSCNPNLTIRLKNKNQVVDTNFLIQQCDGSLSFVMVKEPYGPSYASVLMMMNETSRSWWCW